MRDPAAGSRVYWWRALLHALRAKKEPRTGGSAAEGSQLWGDVRRGGRTVERLGFKCRGLKKEGGNLLRGYPRQKKPRRFASIGAFMAHLIFRPPTSSAASD